MKKMLLLLFILVFTGCSNSSNEPNNPPPTQSNDITLSETTNNNPDDALINNISDVIVEEKISNPTTSLEEDTVKTSEPIPNEPVNESTVKEPEIKKEYPIGIEIDHKAPDFSAISLSGNQVKLSDYIGKTVFLNFWATWCGPCTMELPYIQKIHETYSDIVILTVNCGEDPKDIKMFMDKNNYTFPVLTDESSAISYMYYTDYIPLSLVIDKDGIIKERHVGSLSEKEMLKMLNIEN